MRTGNSALGAAMGMATGPQHAFRFTIDDPAERDVVDAIGTPNAFNPGPPLYDPVRQILVHYDTIGRQVAAHAYGGPGSLDLLWTLPFCNTVQVRRFCPKISSEIEPVRAACELDPAVRLNAQFVQGLWFGNTTPVPLCITIIDRLGARVACGQELK